MKNIYVGNLSFGSTEAGVRSLFASYGTVARVNICTDLDTGQPRGFGFVEMENDEDGQKAITALNGTDHEGRTLSVSEARPRANRAGAGAPARKRY